jgi:acetylornithine deacetylase/succinyl-diaminopimelate desuccinylase-like protein
MPSDDLRAAVSELMPQAKADLAELVAFPSIADGTEPDACRAAAEWTVRAFADAGLQDVTTHTTPDGSECVVGHAPGPEGAPTVLLYSHYDVQPPLGEADWLTPVWQLDERDGRWYGRGTADCKGNLVMHLLALRAVRGDDGTFPVNVKVIVEGSEEQGTGGLERFLPDHADLLRADVICIADAGNTAIGVPTLTTSLRGMAAVDVTLEALGGAQHSGLYGGAAPDPVAGLVRLLASLHDDAGNTTVDGLDNTGTWTGVEYPEDRFRADAQVLDGVDLVGDGSVADRLWARYDVTTIGIDVPSVADSVNAVQASAKARISLRVPPGVGAEAAQQALIEHLRARVPWHLRFTATSAGTGEPWSGQLEGPGFEALRAGLEEAYGAPLTTQGVGGSIPLCNVLKETFPAAEIMLYGVEEPTCQIHAPNESVAASEVEAIALAEALFLRNLGAATA